MKKGKSVVITENLPGSAYRKAIYQSIQSAINRELTNDEHKFISGILKLYVASAVRSITQKNEKNEKKRS